MTAFRTHYDNLQVAESASAEVIRAAYKSLIQKWHPDKHPDDAERAERFLRIINRAYEVLSDPAQRREHDEWIADQRGWSEPPLGADITAAAAAAEPAPSRPPVEPVGEGGRRRLPAAARRWMLVIGGGIAAVLVVLVVSKELARNAEDDAARAVAAETQRHFEEVVRACVVNLIESERGRQQTWEVTVASCNTMARQMLEPRSDFKPIPYAPADLLERYLARPRAY